MKKAQAIGSKEEKKERVTQESYLSLKNWREKAQDAIKKPIKKENVDVAESTKQLSFSYRELMNVDIKEHNKMFQNGAYIGCAIIVLAISTLLLNLVTDPDNKSYREEMLAGTVLIFGLCFIGYITRFSQSMPMPKQIEIFQASNTNARGESEKKNTFTVSWFKPENSDKNIGQELPEQSESRILSRLRIEPRG